MSRQVRCPNCGGEHDLVNPGITMLVCNFCSSTVYWGSDQQAQAGTKSILPESDTRLFHLAAGQLQGVGYQVVGHLRYDHGRGSWDEWYLQLDDGRVAWVSEDERELSLEVPSTTDEPLPDASNLQVGHPISIGGVAFTVREVGTARCIGGQGQLPFTILPEETYRYADLASADGTRFATLEYDKGDRPTCFVGHVLTHEHLQIDDEKPPSTAAPTKAQHIKCSNCNAPLEIPTGREVETKVCEYCGAQLDLTGAEQSVLGVNPRDYDPCFSFEVGQKGQFYGRDYEVCGRMLYEDDERYQSREYLLFNPDAGYVWLAEEEGHYILNRPTQQAPNRNPFSLATKQHVKVGKTAFRFYERGVVQLTYVDGALPWLAKVGDRSQYAALTAPPQLFSIESDGNEIEYFHGRYTTPKEVWQAFKLKDKPRRPFGIHASQPFGRSTTVKMIMVSGLIFAAVNLALIFWSFGQRGKEVFSKTFLAADYTKETVSPPFELPGSNVVGLHMAAPLNNSWLAMEVAFLDSQDRVVAEMDNEIGYYTGRDSEGTWTEGRRRKTAYFKAPPPGQYRLILRASGGGQYRGSVSRGEPLTVSVRSGAILTRYFVFAFIATFLFPFFEVLRKFLFENRRWAPVTEDDD